MSRVYLRTYLRSKAREIDPTDPEVRKMEAIQRAVRLEIDKQRNEYNRCITKRIFLPLLFVRSFINEICFRRIEVIECEDLEPLRTAIITSQDTNQSLEECLLNYNKWNIETDRKIDILDEEHTVKEIHVSELLQASEFFKDGLLIEDQARFISPENRICFLLGLEIDFLDRLETFEEDIRYHKITEEWIQIFLENKFEEIEDESLKLNLSEELFVQIGFRANSRAVKTLVSRSERVIHHNDPLSSVQRFVRDEFKYNPLLSGRDYNRTESVRCELYSESSSKTICMFDVTNDSQEAISAHISELSDDDHIVLYHGTDRASAVDIFSGGIDVNMGLPKRDFSDGLGFYLTDDLEHAKLWAFSQTSKPAILVFKLTKIFLEEAQSLDLETSENTDYWRDIVHAFRAGNPSKTMRKDLRNALRQSPPPPGIITTTTTIQHYHHNHPASSSPPPPPSSIITTTTRHHHHHHHQHHHHHHHHHPALSPQPPGIIIIITTITSTIITTTTTIQHYHHNHPASSSPPPPAPSSPPPPPSSIITTTTRHHHHHHHQHHHHHHHHHPALSPQPPGIITTTITITSTIITTTTTIQHYHHNHPASSSPPPPPSSIITTTTRHHHHHHHHHHSASPPPPPPSGIITTTITSITIIIINGIQRNLPSGSFRCTLITSPSCKASSSGCCGV
ncbi:hypothetical protein QZH41_006500 [Actinostola sp. cb2023]|nr:hypothetical protein QZH41_006500 [Actinostola sp. cb2023]